MGDGRGHETRSWRICDLATYNSTSTLRDRLRAAPGRSQALASIGYMRPRPEHFHHNFSATLPIPYRTSPETCPNLDKNPRTKHTGTVYERAMQHTSAVGGQDFGTLHKDAKNSRSQAHQSKAHFQDRRRPTVFSAEFSAV